MTEKVICSEKGRILAPTLTLTLVLPQIQIEFAAMQVNYK